MIENSWENHKKGRKVGFAELLKLKTNTKQ